MWLQIISHKNSNSIKEGSRMSEENCCEKASDDGWNFGWDEGAKFMMRSVAELMIEGF